MLVSLLVGDGSSSGTHPNGYATLIHIELGVSRIVEVFCAICCALSRPCIAIQKRKAKLFGL
jgi:hypothetical protein